MLFIRLFFVDAHLSKNTIDKIMNSRTVASSRMLFLNIRASQNSKLQTFQRFATSTIFNTNSDVTEGSPVLRRESKKKTSDLSKEPKIPKKKKSLKLQSVSEMSESDARYKH